MRVSMYLNKLWSIFLLLILGSCIPEEEPVAPYDRGDVNVVELEMGQRFSKMVFYSLSEQKIIDECELSDWDLYLDESEIRLNPSRYMAAALTNATSFDEISDTSGLSFQYDPSSGKGEKVLKANTNIYVLDLGISGEGLPLGFLLARITDEGDSYLLETAELGGTKQEKQSAPKASYYSFSEQSTFDLIAPDAYDLVFTRYPQYFPDEGVYYLVTGALSGNSTEIRQVDDQSFDEIDYAFYEARADVLGSEEDIIGYDWKEYDFDAAFYEIVPNRSYLIRDSKGFVYKLRFTSYYDQEGQSGHPSFEYLLL